MATLTLASQTVLDNFDDNSISANWTNWGGAQVVESTQQLKLTTHTGASSFYGIDYIPALDLEEVFVGCKVVSVGTTLNRIEFYPIIGIVNSNNSFYWEINRQTGNISCWTNINGTHTQRGTNPAYDSDVHVYFAVGVHNDLLHWLYSTDGETWTIHITQSNPYGTTALQVAEIQVGTSGSTSATRTLTVDDFSLWEEEAEAPAFEGTGTVTGIGSLTAGAGIKGGIGGGTVEATGSLTSLFGKKAASGTGTVTAVASLSQSHDANGTGTVTSIASLTSAGGIKHATGTGVITAIAFLSGSGIRPSFFLEPPGRPTGAFHDGKVRGRGEDLLRFYGFNQGLAIVKRDGEWSLKTVVNQDLDEKYYQGGMRHRLTNAERDELVEAGFGQYIEASVA